MEFTYTITLDDLLRFGKFVYRTSRTVRHTKMTWCIIIPLFFAGWAAYYYWETRSFDLIFVSIVLPSITSTIFLPRLIDRMSLQKTYRHFIVQPKKSDLGVTRLVVQPEWIIEFAPQRETRCKWSDLCKVEETENYLYLFKSSKSAFIIPRHSINPQTYAELRNLVFKYFEPLPR